MPKILIWCFIIVLYHASCISALPLTLDYFYYWELRCKFTCTIQCCTVSVSSSYTANSNFLRKDGIGTFNSLFWENKLNNQYCHIDKIIDKM